jgi:hypothetical protein
VWTFFELVQDWQSVLQSAIKSLTDVGDRKFAASFLEQDGTELIFQIHQLTADGGLIPRYGRGKTLLLKRKEFADSFRSGADRLLRPTRDSKMVHASDRGGVLLGNPNALGLRRYGRHLTLCEAKGVLMTPEEALMTILRLIDGSDEVNDERALQTLLRSIKTLAEKGLKREPT